MNRYLDKEHLELQGQVRSFAREFVAPVAREIDEEIRHIIEQGLGKARDILDNRRDALVALAELLIEKEVIGADELKEAIETSSPTPKIVPGTGSVPKRPVAEEEQPPESEATGSG